MTPIKTTTLFILFLLLAGCSEDNDYDGTGLIGQVASISSSTTTVDPIVSLQSFVFTANAEALVENIQTMQKRVESIDTSLSEREILKLQVDFEAIATAWKSVEASYIVGDFESSLIDTPRYIDYFHEGKALDVAADIDKVLNQTGDIQVALNKNSSKGINALEYLAFGYYEPLSTLKIKMKTNNLRRIEVIKAVLKNLKTQATLIFTFYKNDTKIKSDVQETSSAIVNVLADSAYKLREWRIGEAAGFVLKYKDSPNPSRLEYYYSRLSLEMIKAVIETHEEVMGEQSYGNFGSFASSNGAKAIVTKIRNQINLIQATLDTFSTPLEGKITTTSVDPKVTEIYEMIRVLQSLYYDSLIQSLNLTAEIIEADGD